MTPVLRRLLAESEARRGLPEDQLSPMELMIRLAYEQALIRAQQAEPGDPQPTA